MHPEHERVRLGREGTEVLMPGGRSKRCRKRGGSLRMLGESGGSGQLDLLATLGMHMEIQVPHWYVHDGPKTDTPNEGAL